LGLTAPNLPGLGIESGHFAWPPTDVEDQERAASPRPVTAIIGLPILLPLYFSAHWSSHARECVSTRQHIVIALLVLDANLRDPALQSLARHGYDALDSEEQYWPWKAADARVSPVYFEQNPLSGHGLCIRCHRRWHRGCCVYWSWSKQKGNKHTLHDSPS
jgi:hypothetical protein